ncbi:GIN domain-containing protein [Flagellimonas algicola]|uniref:Putative auto-transporter adhesin head GIN domain-containing protein n=1 Tax=Flagellimonas algicola TaxID=2583815 RepID=A0ABY2WPJ9_9FLAO|nr:DUF2807 domain-containing protein [Allomuricauda algicola]TMU56914.1 hypothetical protein FGG15_05040 [Allomuricauda algicola]
MKKSSLILWGALIAILLFSFIFQLFVHSYVKEGKANIKPVQMLKQNRQLSHFTVIKASGRLKILMEQQDAVGIEVNAPDYIIDSIRTLIIDDTLDISVVSSLKKKDSIILRISNPEYHGLQFSSETSVESVGTLSGTNLDLKFSDKSSGNLELSYERLNYTNTSTGSVNLNGKINQLYFMEEKNN